MDAHDRLGRLLRYSYAGDAAKMLTDYALRGLRVRIIPGWTKHAACQTCDGEAWFPDERTKPNPLVEKVCVDCPVRKACLATAILREEEGIWGGTRRGQRLHARARLLNDEHPGDVLADLLASPIPDTDYHVPDPRRPVEPAAPNQADPDHQAWREAS
jgi:hypothetical protein